MATKLVTQIAQKDDSGTIDYGEEKSLGVSFGNVYDERSGSGNYTLQQLFDHYINYMKNANFVYQGATQPTNTHVALWIDTGTPQY